MDKDVLIKTLEEHGVVNIKDEYGKLVVKLTAILYLLKKKLKINPIL